MRSIAHSATLLVVVLFAVAAAQAPESFEVVSVKPMGAAAAEVLARFGSGCDGSFPRVDNRRFTVTTTAYALITWAYGFNKNGGCGFVTNGNFIIGGPSWVRTKRFAIQALMPEGTQTPSLEGFLNGNEPALETMLRGMLADRFKLVVHREMRESPVYALVTARGGAKLTPAKADAPTFYRIGQQRDADGRMVDHLVVSNANMTYVGIMLGIVTRRPVVDRTGLSGGFSFDIPFASQDANAPDTSAPSIFTALQEQLGLRLENTRAPVEVLVIDRVEPPTEN